MEIRDVCQKSEAKKGARTVMTKYGHAWTRKHSLKDQAPRLHSLLSHFIFFLYNQYYDDEEKNSPGNIPPENHHIRNSVLPLSPSS